MKNYIAIALLMSSAVAFAQNTTKLTASKSGEYGIIYNLPVTALDIVIETQFTQSQPGDFKNYAKRYLDINDAIVNPVSEVDITSTTIIPRGVPDNDNQWLMSTKNSAGVYVVLNDRGVPVAINTEDVPSEPEPELPVPVKAAPTPLETPAARQAVTQEMSLSTSTSKRAQLAAQRVFELRESRNELLAGQADNMPPDGKSMQLMLDNLADQEAALTAMFAGTVKQWTDVQTLTFTPDDEDINNMIVARVSPTKGLVNPDDLSGEPIYLTLEVIGRGTLPNDEKGQPRKTPKDAVAYAIPGQAQITLTFRGRTLATQQVDLAQLGVTYGLDPKIFTDKKAPASAIFSPTTGALLELNF